MQTSHTRTCLDPSLGEAAQDLMLELALDADEEVAFAAMGGVAFHCGVNCGAEPFLDRKIEKPGFLAKARAKVGLRERASQIDSDPGFQARFALLKAVLEGKG